VGWFLDTNTVVFCLRGKSPLAMRRLHAVAAADVRFLAFLAPFNLVLPDAQVEDHYVIIRTQLEAQGTPISEADLWIAATAHAAGGTVVTNNVRKFSRVPDLLVVDWTVPRSKLLTCESRAGSRRADLARFMDPVPDHEPAEGDKVK
jgi:tRNA(fMet)-specific endonuclease VapC